MLTLMLLLILRAVVLKKKLPNLKLIRARMRLVYKRRIRANMPI